MDTEKKDRLQRRVILILGAFFCILLCIIEENGLIYFLSPWIWISCFLFYTRTMERKREWLFFALIFLASYEIRYGNFMGSSDMFFIISSSVILFLLALATTIPFVLDRFYFKNGYGAWKNFLKKMTALVVVGVLGIASPAFAKEQTDEFTLPKIPDDLTGGKPIVWPDTRDCPRCLI